MEIFKLVGSIFVDNEKANKSLSATESHAGSVAGKLASGVKVAAKFGAVVGTAAIGAATALYKTAEKAAGATDEIDKMSQKIGISAEAYQEFDFILSQSGTDVSVLKGGIKTLTNQMQSAVNGTESAADAFKALNVEFTDADGNMRSQEDVMYDTMLALQGVECQTQKAALATKLFGRAGTELMPLLNGETGSIEEMKKQAHDLGLVLDEDAISAGVKLTDTMDQVKRSFDAIITQIGVKVMPIVQQAMEYIMQNIPTIQSVMSSVFGVVQNVVQTTISVLSTAFNVGKLYIDEFSKKLEDGGITFDSVIDGLKTGFETAMSAIKDVYDTVVAPLMDIIKQVFMEVYTQISPYFPTIGKMVVKAFKGIKETWEKHLKPAFEAIYQFVNDVLMPVFKFAFEGVILPTIKTMFKQGSVIVGAFKTVLDDLLDFITGVFSGDWEKVWDSLKNLVVDAFGGIGDILKGMFNNYIDMINSLIKTINGSELTEIIKGITGKTWNIPLIPQLAKGGEISGSGTAIVGEAGAELVHLPKGASVTPINDRNNALSATEELLKEVNTNISLLREEIANSTMMIDGDVLVGRTVKKMNKALGNLADRQSRGVVVSG